jgi:hypothetical protein
MERIGGAIQLIVHKRGADVIGGRDGREEDEAYLELPVGEEAKELGAVRVELFGRDDKVCKSAEMGETTWSAGPTMEGVFGRTRTNVGRVSFQFPLTSLRGEMSGGGPEALPTEIRSRFRSALISQKCVVYSMPRKEELTSDQCPLPRQHSPISIKRRFSNTIKDCDCSFSIGLLVNSSLEFRGGTANDDDGSAVSAGELRFSEGGSGTDGFDAKRFGDLNEIEADSAGSS